MDFKDIQAHTVRALNQSPKQTDGFEWFSIADIFPDDVFQRLLEQDANETAAEMLEIFDNPEFVAALFSKFYNSPLRSKKISSIYTFPQSSGAGYTLKPHVDSYPRVFTMTVYLAPNNDYASAGTAVYEADRATRTWRTLGTAPFLRNYAKVIAPYDDLTWHGVDLITDPVERRSVVVVFSDQTWDESQLHYAEWKPGRTVEYYA